MIALAMVFGMVSCQPKETKLYIATINDMHANIDNFPKMAALIDSLRSVHPDLLLIYDLDDGVLVLTLFRTGSHSDLF